MLTLNKAKVHFLISILNTLKFLKATSRSRTRF